MKLSSRFSTLFALLALCAALLLTLVWSALLNAAAERQALNRLRAEDSLLAASAGPLFSRPEELDSLVRSAGEKLGVRVTAIRADGTVVSDSEVNPADVPRMQNHATRPEVVAARQWGTGSSRRFSVTLDRNFVYLADRVKQGEELIGYMRLAIAVDDLRAEESPTVWAGRAAIFFACLLLFAVGSRLSRRFAAPLNRVLEATLAVARGDLSRDPPEESEPEAAALSDAVGWMKRSLLEALSAVQSRQRLTAAVFDRLPLGLAVLDRTGKIEEANSGFCTVFESPIPTGRTLMEIAREPELHALAVRAFDTGVEYDYVWNRPGDSVWEVHALPLPDPGWPRVVLLFRDVTPLSRNEAMRRQFVADVSHELRTPVASVAAAAETLTEQECDPEETAQLHALILRQAKRMGELIGDLIDLSRIESGAIELKIEDVDLEDVARDVHDEFSLRAAQRKIPIEIRAEPDVTVRGDQRRIFQIVHNLVDNAIKFSPDGAPVTVEVRRIGERPTVAVTDHGPGIAPAEREKIFQRFYQIDPSRSSSRPGTGLGLAIVKHLSLLHQATVEVGGESGRGARFLVIFPERRAP